MRLPYSSPQPWTSSYPFQLMPKTAAMIVTQTEEGTFTVLDASGTLHEASSVEELGAVCHLIVNNPDLPQYETQSAQASELEEAAIKFAEVVLPEQYSFMAAPAAGFLKKAVTKLQSVSVASGKMRIESTPESRKEGAERARKRRQEIEKKKLLAKKAAQARRKAGPRLSSLRLKKKSA